MMSKFFRPQIRPLLTRLKESKGFIQMLTGARQVGKTTLATQAMLKLKCPYHFASADGPGLQSREWLEIQWETARLTVKNSKKKWGVLVLDEVQKIPNWSEVVKKLWDQDKRKKQNLKVVLLGSSPLLLSRGLTESLAGRFETLHLPHWSFSEMRQAFGWNLNQYLFYGAYPGAAPLIRKNNRWASYIRDSLMETTISRDVLLMSRIDKPALLRRLFDLGCAYSGQILSYTKMTGQLQEAGNTTTLAHYLHLLEGVGMLAGLQKYAGSKVKQRSSSPKLQVLNNALMTAGSNHTLSSAQLDKEFWGRLTESAIGACLLNGAISGNYKVFYWRDSQREVDFVVRKGKHLIAIEVKSGRSSGALAGMKAFSSAFHPTKKLIIGEEGLPIEKFLSKPPEYWLF